MNDKFKDFPLCINCKYFMEEKTGPNQVKQNCGLTMVNPVNGEYEPRGNRQAASYRKQGNPCDVAGLFFKPKEGKKTQPKKKPVVVEVKAESTAKVIEVETPLMVDVNVDMNEPTIDPDFDMPEDFGLDTHPAQPAEPPKKRRRRSK